MNANQALLEAAARHLGNRDGARWLSEAGFGHLDPTSAWCSTFMLCITRQVGLAPRATAAARSWLHEGEAVALADALPGDIAVFWRGKPSSWKAHVALYQRTAAANAIVVLGGNQGGSVSSKSYPANRLLGLRRLSILVPASSPKLV
jgi:uncharacterized protein (TIGR02594 family)